MHQFLVSASLLIIQCFIFSVAGGSDPTFPTSEIWINCGSTGASTAVDGRKWAGDNKHRNFTIKGSSTRSSVLSERINSVDSVPYKTARISRSQFSYIFELSSGQKFVTLHFYPTLYHGFERYMDLFNVEASQFTLLSNFNASVTADALGVNFFVKEFCIIVEENQPLNITFYPATANDQSQDIYAFVNGIEIISVHESISLCHTRETGVQVVGEKSMVYIDKSTALEMVYRRNLKMNPPVLPNDDSRGRFGMWARVLNKNVKNVNNITWRVPVDIGFRYLVRLHFCEIGLNLAKSNNKSFVLLIDHMTVDTSAEIFRDIEGRHSMFYKNYMVITKGRKEDGKRNILISLQSENEFIYRHGPLEGFEIFKLSNHYNSLASPNPLLPIWDSPSLPIQYPQKFSSHRNTIAAMFITLICLVNVIVHIMRQTCDAIFPEEETKPSTRAARLCRHFSLSEIKLATENFRDTLIIGKGGFGIVYKGLIDNSTVVAVKRLKPNSKQGKREFWKEIETLSELRHTNLVPLIGYCNEQGEMILVYAYMPNGTLADHLYKLVRKNKSFSILSWEDRLKICIGAGRGLDYLHSGHGIIHRDVKASNILLDETFVAKVSDFGLVKSEKEIQFQSQESSPKGTFGYFDPDYFRTCKLTMKSDTYSFGVLLLEVLCGRPAVDPLAGEDMHSLTVWALDKIRRGDPDKIVAQSLRREILPDSLKAFVGIAEKCLQNEPKKRPTIAHVIINLEFVLEQQNANSLAPNGVASVADILPHTDRIQQGSTSLLTGVSGFLPRTDRTSMSTQDITVASSYTPNSTSFLKEQVNTIVLNPEPPYGKNKKKKTIMGKISRILPWETKSWKRAKVPKKNDFGISMSAPILKNTNSKAPSRGSTTYLDQRFSATHGGNDLSSTSNFRIFSFSELKAATKNFRPDTVLGQGGFGGVYKGYLEERPTNRKGSVSVIPIAIKRLTRGSSQGFNEWLAEVNFLGRLSHPNLVNLLGYCHEKEELLLVYEFMQNNSLDRHLFSKDSAVQALSWNLRLKILTGAARGLAYLHSIPIIHRDFKTSNVLLDKSYNAKISDFGLAKDGPDEGGTHVTTRVMGTVGYLAPEYMMTGHLTAKGDVYSFGVILLEILTGLPARDAVKEQLLKNKMELKKFMDSRLEGRYPPKSALELFQLAGNCLKYDKKARPLMYEVVETLERAHMIDEISREPRVRFVNEV